MLATSTYTILKFATMLTNMAATNFIYEAATAGMCNAILNVPDLLETIPNGSMLKTILLHVMGHHTIFPEPSAIYGDAFHQHTYNWPQKARFYLHHAGFLPMSETPNKRPFSAIDDGASEPASQE